MLKILDHIPDKLLATPAKQLGKVLNAPTLIHLTGKHHAPIFISVLLHGNETTGWDAVRQYLHQHQGQLPRSLSLFIGNVLAAEQGKRHLPDQVDFNRIWKNTDTAEEKMIQQILAQMQSKKVFASVDIHNNTGMNPHYACVNKLEADFLFLASLFSHKVVYFLRPNTVQSMAFSSLCPAVTVECGVAGNMDGIQHVRYFIEKVMALTHFDHPPAYLSVYHTIATIKVPPEFDFVFNSECDAKLCFREDIDTLNFCDLPVNTPIAYLPIDPSAYLYAFNEQGEEVREQFLHYLNGSLCTKVPVMPAMLTCNKEIVRQDCLCYFMERVI